MASRENRSVTPDRETTWEARPSRDSSPARGASTSHGTEVSALVSGRLGPGNVIVLDGGLGTHLETRGADVTGALWSAQILRDAPEEVRAAHRDFFEAGAQAAITCSYQVSADGLLAAGLAGSRAEAERECERLLRLSVDVAAQAARDVGRVDADAAPSRSQTGAAPSTEAGNGALTAGGSERTPFASDAAVDRGCDVPGASVDRGLDVTGAAVARQPIVAASIGPYGAGPGEGTEYDGSYGLGARQLAAWHRPRIEVLAASGADVLLAETIPSIVEVEALADELARTGRPWMLSVTAAQAGLRDGTSLGDVVRALDGAEGLVALGVNCCAPDQALAAVRCLAEAGAAPLMAYPNSGETWDRRARAWRPAPSGTPESITGLVPDFLDAGVRLIGGCCRVGPGEIGEIARAVRA
ncbi:MAG: homocysteine S-methyltransferase [Actinomycetaceae bacterium]|nr:homocysteine S-methyltransferase [Actinomycetaceae bacterium]